MMEKMFVKCVPDLAGLFELISHRQNGCHFADDIFRCIFINSVNLVLKGPIDSDPALVQATVWRRIGDKPLPKPMLTEFTDAYMRH